MVKIGDDDADVGAVNSDLQRRGAVASVGTMVTLSAAGRRFDRHRCIH